MAEEGRAETAGEDRSEAPTPRRLEKAREQGQVALSREVIALGSLGGSVLGLVVAMTAAEETVRGLRRYFVWWEATAGAEAMATALALGAWLVLPVAVGGTLGAVAATLLQTRGLISAKPLRPKLARLSPKTALKRLFGIEGAIELVRTMLKFGLIGAALLWVLGDVQRLLPLLQSPLERFLTATADAVSDLFLAALAVLAVIAVLDLHFVRFRHFRQLRMSRQDLKEELRETEGDPQIKGRQPRLREGRARRRMMAAVAKATVVITNPTHLAVALAYERGSSAAPRVVAKGGDLLAIRIRTLAEEAGVPVVCNPPLARALFRLELESEIPPEHYQAVAEIIAYLWRLGRQNSGEQG